MVLMDDAGLPEWVAWLAQDADGSWWAYEVEPSQFHQGWYENELGRRQVLEPGAPNPDWSKSLRRAR